MDGHYSSLSALDPAFATGIVENRSYCVKMNSLPLKLEQYGVR